ncbi:MAG: hypothetical protein ABI234_17860 [Ktedonobacteraceae bacterium]
MAENKNRVQAGRLLKEEGALQVYELSTISGYGVGGFDLVTAAFNSTGVAVRVSSGTEYAGSSLPAASQVVLTRDGFAALVASYRAYERAEKKRYGTLSDGDFDPFLDEGELP